ncbi:MULTISPECIES: hypothetical protein [Paraburkholderia]|uniref:Uncharacterized protein n=2 Tax=Paraburkholderia madseniana TaxID=2599607 RepID=A0A6N6WBU7_9BURK|nr:MULTISPECIES: hypothetical protein [Paraburkholderia]KAE8758135.1 hypothetical protein FSO04_20370 [Paraburkholderia madseniana]MCX4147058.1 hypothetical protein [Paraburkholderia madseniana]MCX4173026.1 hypothetical protein [Paraburkholderia madseniana]MDN7150001.1 hypothetical protein [Paraburkholderia sp. WS6]MDQ6408881.1 hypothetical protein [Paraburkholderia madseniana]
MKTISKPVALRLDQHTTAHGAGFSYQLHFARQRPLFAAPSADLLTLVIAEAMKRKAQAEIQRDVLREAIYEIPVSTERGHDRALDIYQSDPDDYT